METIQTLGESWDYGVRCASRDASINDIEVVRMRQNLGKFVIESISRCKFVWREILDESIWCNVEFNSENTLKHIGNWGNKGWVDAIDIVDPRTCHDWVFIARAVCVVKSSWSSMFSRCSSRDGVRGWEDWFGKIWIGQLWYDDEF